MREKEKGAITVEASLVLVMFIMGFMCMISLVKIVHTQTILQYVVDQAALSISRNSYILTKTGVADEIYGTSKKGKKFEGDTAEVIGNIKELYSSIGSTTGSSSEDYIKNAENVMGKYNDVIDGADAYAEEYFSSKDEIWDTLTTWGTMKLEQGITQATVEILVKSQVKTQLEVIGQSDADAYLKRLGIKDGLDGLSFKGSEWMQANSQDKPGIRIEMGYEVEFNWYYFMVKDLKYKVTAYTALW